MCIRDRIHIKHQTLGNFKIVPEVSKEREVKFGTLAGKIHLKEGAFDGWSEEVEELFGMNDDD